MAALCAFANSTAADEGPYMPPLLRAITLHFMMGYDHYFADGNGRTSRAVFYWSMLRQGFFLAEFLSISRLLRRAPARYARSFLYTEDDDGDLTYFYLEQARAIVHAIDDLDKYLTRKTAALRDANRFLRGRGLNHRQVAVIERFLRDPGRRPRWPTIRRGTMWSPRRRAPICRTSRGAGTWPRRSRDAAWSGSLRRISPAGWAPTRRADAPARSAAPVIRAAHGVLGGVEAP